MELLLILDDDDDDDDDEGRSFVRSFVLSVGYLTYVVIRIVHVHIFRSVGFLLGSFTSPADGWIDGSNGRCVSHHKYLLLFFLISQRSQRSCDECWCISGFKSMIDSVPFFFVSSAVE